jgi:hypothetical protein
MQVPCLIILRQGIGGNELPRGARCTKGLEFVFWRLLIVPIALFELKEVLDFLLPLESLQVRPTHREVGRDTNHEHRPYIMFNIII